MVLWCGNPKAIPITLWITDSKVRARLAARRHSESAVQRVGGLPQHRNFFRIYLVRWGLSARDHGRFQSIKPMLNQGSEKSALRRKALLDTLCESVLRFPESALRFKVLYESACQKAPLSAFQKALARKRRFPLYRKQLCFRFPLSRKQLCFPESN